ncbi:hypothetical protein HOLleu_38342 [Holothuria leucospilota]|uniref:Uncharacterized protein n=1 Tax=Holothuria leucospilota TaxID=206669 RepID=A0A9Q0YLS6_HOLLE|nr:hypothetical protein HOLleu_38342 [Holothuria leucospilota]
MLFLSSICCFSILIMGSLFTIYWYTVCFLGKSDHLFRFLSFLVTYWSVILSAQIICFAALARNNRRWRYHIYQETSWVNLFREATFARKISSLDHSNRCCLPSMGAALFFYGIAAYLSFLEMYHFSIQHHRCSRIPLQLYISHVSYIFSVFFFATFCYCLYLQRRLLEGKHDDTISFITKHSGKLYDCMDKTCDFFKEYIQLRSLLLRWLSFVLCCVAFGLAIFFTMNYKHLFSLSDISTMDDHDNEQTNNKFCTISCDKPTQAEVQISFLIFDLLVFSEKLTIAAFALVIVGGLDIKSEWDSFRMSLHFMQTAKDGDFWKKFLSFVKKLHYDTTTETITSLIIPVLGLGIGLLSDGYVNI